MIDINPYYAVTAIVFAVCVLLALFTKSDQDDGSNGKSPRA
jgi:hypothetical protein